MILAWIIALVATACHRMITNILTAEAMAILATSETNAVAEWEKLPWLKKALTQAYRQEKLNGLDWNAGGVNYIYLMHLYTT